MRVNVNAEKVSPYILLCVTIDDIVFQRRIRKGGPIIFTINFHHTCPYMVKIDFEYYRTVTDVCARRNVGNKVQ